MPTNLRDKWRRHMKPKIYRTWYESLGRFYVRVSRLPDKSYRTPRTFALWELAHIEAARQNRELETRHFAAKEEE